MGGHPRHRGRAGEGRVGHPYILGCLSLCPVKGINFKMLPYRWARTAVPHYQTHPPRPDYQNADQPHTSLAVFFFRINLN